MEPNNRNIDHTKNKVISYYKNMAPFKLFFLRKKNVSGFSKMTFVLPISLSRRLSRSGICFGFGRGDGGSGDGVTVF